MDTYLKAMRQAKGLTQQQVADSCGIAQAHYCSIELGRKRPSVPLAKALGRTLGLDWTRLFEDVGGGDADDKAS